MNDAHRRTLADMRQAAEQRDHEQAQYALKRLLSELDYYYALALVIERLHAWLDIFESYYPDEEWVRKLIIGVTSFGMAPDDGIATAALNQPFNEPGAGNYIKAVYDLTQAMQGKHTSSARVGFMASAIVNTMMAELVEAWYGDRPDEWATVRAQPDAPNAQEIAYAFWMSAQTATLDTANWLEIADRLAATLERQTIN